jgi:hypothetical protein
MCLILARQWDTALMPKLCVIDVVGQWKKTVLR